MNDFLARLVARTTVPAASIRPRLPALFEPSLAPPDDTVESVVVDTAPAAPRERIRHSDRAESMEPVEYVDHEADHGHRPMARDGDEARPSLATDRLELPLAGERTHERAASEPSSVSSQNRRPIVVDHTIRVDTPVVVERKLRVEETRRIETVEHRELSADGARPSGQAMSTGRVPSREAPLGIRPLQPAPAPLVPPAPVLGAESAPTIEITIGRVEVRAVQPPAPSRRPAAERRGPSLSLEDYLKERNRGRG
jgi:hypothetical protein